MDPAIALPNPVTLSTNPHVPDHDEISADFPHSVESALELAIRLTAILDGSLKSTSALWETLATIAADDLGNVRAIEPHLDAAQILRQAGERVRDGSWGVFAAEGGGDPLLARQEKDGWTLTGTKPWCSLADRLDWALITARLDDGRRSLFAVDLHHPGVRVIEDAWQARGLTEIPSGPVVFAAVPADAVGEPGWYLSRPGFAWGGIGVAACWYGGAVGVARTVHAAAAARPNPFLLMHLGAIDEGLQSARRALAEAARIIDSGSDVDASNLALRVRATVARVVEDILDRTGHALGPAPLATNAEHAKRVSDLQLYVRQHHAERDQSALGTTLAEGPAPW